MLMKLLYLGGTLAVIAREVCKVFISHQALGRTHASLTIWGRTSGMKHSSTRTTSGMRSGDTAVTMHRLPRRYLWRVCMGEIKAAEAHGKEASEVAGVCTVKPADPVCHDICKYVTWPQQDGQPKGYGRRGRAQQPSDGPEGSGPLGKGDQMLHPVSCS